ncbi:hypothetical protein L915_22018, partial [Phytophthora nicotianae]
PSGGSRATVPPGSRKKGLSRDKSAYQRAISILGEAVVKDVREKWDSWDISYGGKEWQQSEGVVMQLLQ